MYCESCTEREESEIDGARAQGVDARPNPEKEREDRHAVYQGDEGSERGVGVGVGGRYVNGEMGGGGKEVSSMPMHSIARQLAPRVVVA